MSAQFNMTSPEVRLSWFLPIINVNHVLSKFKLMLFNVFTNVPFLIL